MTLDITNALADWEFDPDDVTVRTIEGADGREKIQLRLDLGLMQMEVDGRPDGRRVEELRFLARSAPDRGRASTTRRTPTAPRTNSPPRTAPNSSARVCSTTTAT